MTKDFVMNTVDFANILVKIVVRPLRRMKHMLCSKGSSSYKDLPSVLSAGQKPPFGEAI